VRLVLALILLLLSPPLAQAQSPRIERIDIVEPGLYQRTVVAKSGVNTAGGDSTTTSNVKLVAATTTVPARVGTIFGFHYKVSGQLAGAKVELRVVARIPPPGFPNKATHQLMRSIEWTTDSTIGGQGYTDGKFEEPAELVTGTWVLELWYQGRKFADQQFTVVKP